MNLACAEVSNIDHGRQPERLQSYQTFLRDTDALALRGRTKQRREVQQILYEARASGKGAVILIEGPPGFGRTCFTRDCLETACVTGFTLGDALMCGAFPEGHRSQALLHAPRPRLTRSESLHSEVTDGPYALTADATAAPPGQLRTRPGVVWVVATGVEGRLPPGILMSDAPSSAVHRIRLDPLPPQAISQVAEDLLGSPPTARLISLLRRAQGHPTLTVKLLEGMTEEGRVFLRDSKADLENKRIPNRVHIWLEDVLRRGPEPMLRFMTACAFTGQKVTSLERIGAILGTSRDELHRIVESAYRMGFIEGREELKFQSPIMHELFWGYIPSFFPELLQGSTNPAPYPGTSHHRQPFSPRLTLQEMRLILLTSEGYTNQQIARRLAISQHTVNYHLKKLFRKYEVNSRVRLVAAALKDTSPLADYQWPH